MSQERGKGHEKQETKNGTGEPKMGQEEIKLNKKISIEGRTRSTLPNSQNHPGQIPNENNELTNSDLDNIGNININNAQLSGGFDNDKNKEKTRDKKVPQRKEHISQDDNKFNINSYIGLFLKNKEKVPQSAEHIQPDSNISSSDYYIKFSVNVNDNVESALVAQSAEYLPHEQESNRTSGFEPYGENPGQGAHKTLSDENSENSNLISDLVSNSDKRNTGTIY